MLVLAIALILDALFGEPDLLWSRVNHPIVLMGRALSWLEARLNRGTRRRAKGVLALLGLLALSLPLPILIAQIPFGWVLDAFLGAILLAHQSLVNHVQAVWRGLKVSLAEGRRAVAMIVGRDPAQLDEPGVARAAIESAAENFSDAVVAPAFWFAIGGLPGIVAYKAVNTADSMIGHRTERYGEFGWAAARLDDVMNWIPARLTGALFCAVGGGREAWAVMRRDARLHRSPNAGWPEAAMAGSLDLALAGPRIYAEERVDDPYLNPAGRAEAVPGDIDRAIAMLWRAWAGLLGIAVLGVLLG